MCWNMKLEASERERWDHNYIYIYIYIYVCVCVCVRVCVCVYQNLDDVYIKLVWFYGISTIVGYLMLNSVYTHLLNMYMICKHIL